MQRDRASILWTSTAYAESSVTAGPLTFRANVQRISNFYQYQADLTGLATATAYGYRVTMNGATVGGGSFRTAGPGAFSFLAFGDSGENTPAQKTLVSRMNAEPDIAFLVHTGDLAYPQATYALLDTNHFALNAQLFGRLPVFPTPGNHEYMADDGAPYFSAHALPGEKHYYSFDWGDAHFVSLDSNVLCTQTGDRMLEWLEDDLAATRQFWKIVFLHHPPYPTGHHVGDVVCNAAASNVNPIVERHGVQLVLAGHEHGYERSRPLTADRTVEPGAGTVYLITGGGGGGLHNVNPCEKTEVALQAYHYVRFEVDGGALTIRAMGLDGETLDRYEIRPKPSLSPRAVLSIGDYSDSIAPGSLVSVFGRNLALQAQAAAGGPTELGGVRARLDGKPLPILYVSPGQINTRIPLDAAATGLLEIETFHGSVSSRVALLPTAPSILAVTSADGAVVVYLTGLADAAAPVDVLLDRFRFRPSFAGPTPGLPGIYQVNFAVPAELGPGEHYMRVATADALSRMVTLTLH